LAAAWLQQEVAAAVVAAAAAAEAVAVAVAVARFPEEAEEADRS